jgi:hypothetical protein
VLPLCHHTHAPACHHHPLVSPEHSNDGEDESGALNGPEYFSQEPHYIHDEMIDASPGHHPNNIHDSEDDVSVVPNTEELFEEEDEKENVEVRSKNKLLSPIKEVLQVWKHDITLWSSLQDIMQTPIPSKQYLLPIAQLVPYTQTYPQCCTQNIEANSTELTNIRRHIASFI